MLTTGGLPDELSDQEKIAQRYARQLSAERRVDAAPLQCSRACFRTAGISRNHVSHRYLPQPVCGLLNAFEIPAPGSQV